MRDGISIVRKVVFTSFFVLSCIVGQKLPSIEKTSLEDRANQLSQMNLGFSKSEIYDICHFIEREQGKHQRERQVYYSHDTHLPCTIEHSKVLHGFLIRDLPNKSRIGTGVHKVVNRAILYGSCLKTIAACYSDDSAKEEIKVLRELRGCRGIVPYLGSVAHRNHTYTVYLDYFPEGSLKRKIASGVKFTQDQIFKIAQDSIQGLISMHRHKIVHRDLHAGNILLRSTKDGQYEAALVDFGRSRKYNKIGNGLPQAASSRNPPEGLITSFRKLDRFRVDVYAMACNFYYLLWRKSHSWASAYNSHDMSVYSKSDRKKIYSFIVREYKKTKKEKLSLIAEKIKNGKPLTRMEKFKVITFKMLDFEPSRRPSLAQIAEDLKKLTIKKREQVKSS